MTYIMVSCIKYRLSSGKVRKQYKEKIKCTRRVQGKILI